MDGGGAGLAARGITRVSEREGEALFCRPKQGLVAR